MKKWIIILAISVLAIGVIVSVVLYAQENGKLKDARAEIVGLEWNVLALESNVSTLEAELGAAEAEVTRLEGDLTAAEAAVSRLEGDLTAAEAAVSRLDRELTAAEAEATRLEGELATAKAKVSTLEADLEKAQEELAKVKDPRHFESLEELEAWLAQDDTDTRIRWQSIPPYERAFILQVRALRDGYLLPAWFEDFSSIPGGQGHFDEDHFDGLFDYAGNLAYIGDEIWYVWAADDSVFLYVFDMFPIPSHPLPLEQGE